MILKPDCISCTPPLHSDTRNHTDLACASTFEQCFQPQEFEEDHGVFNYADFFNDYFMGVVRNPRLFHGILKVPFDLKRFWNARPGLTGWVILNISYLATWL